MPTVQQLPAATAVNLTDEVMIDQGGNSVAATIAQVLDAQPLGTGLVRAGDTIAADTTVLATLASPALTGTPTAPAPPAGDNSTRLATTAFVQASVTGNTLTLSGDISGVGSGTIDTTLAAVATPGTYEKVTIDAKGRVLSGAALAGGDISAALGFTPIAGNETITLSGDLSGSGTTAITATLPAVVTPGAYAKVSVDAKGRVIAGGTLAASDLAGALPGADVSAADVTAGGGSAARTLAVRAADRINVLDYGADPTGAADSAAAFASAMAAIPSGGWGFVWVPRGSYRLASAVNQPAGRSVRVVFDDGANIAGPGYLGVDCVESHQGAFRTRQVGGGYFGFAPSLGDAANPGFSSEFINNTPQNSLSMRVGWDRRYTNTNTYGKVHAGIDIAEQRIHSWPNLYDNSSGWGLWEVIESTTLDEDTMARANLSSSAELSETDVVNNGPEAGWTWHSGVGNTVQGMSIDPWGQNGNYGGHVLFNYGSVGGFDGQTGGLNQRWFSYPAVFSAGNPTAAAGTLVINGSTVNIAAAETLAAIAAAVNAAAIADVRAAVSTWGGVVSRLVIYSTVANDLGTLTLAGTALASLGLSAGTTTTPRGNYAAVVGNSSGAAAGDQFVVNGSTITIGGSGSAADVAAAINAAGIAGIAADTNANGSLIVTCYVAVQTGGLVLADVSGGGTLGKLALNAGTYLPPTPPKAFATACSDMTSPVCQSTDQITIAATDASGTGYGPVTVTLNGGGGTGWPADVAASIEAALSAAGFYAGDFTALSAPPAVVAVRAVGGGASQGVQIRNTAGGTLTLADAHGSPLETLGIAAGTYQPGGYSPGAQTVFMAAEDSIAPGGRGVFVGGVSNATDATVFPHTPFEARGGFLHGLRLDQANFADNNAIVVAPAHAIAWGTKAEGQHTLTVASGTLAFDGAPIVNSAAVDAAFGSETGDLLVRTAAGWAALAPGNQGQVLGANGPGTPLAWTTPIPNIAPGAVLASSNTVGVAGTISASAILDQIASPTYGDILYRGASGWAVLAPGTTGQLLQSGGPGADVAWVNAPSGGAGQWSAGTVDAVGGGLFVSGTTLEGPALLSVYATPGSFTYTPRAGSSFVRVRLRGGGGGGGGGIAVAAGANSSGGGGGGGGAYLETVFDAADLAAGVNLTVATGGTGGNNGAGGQGGTTSVSTAAGLYLAVPGGGGGAQGQQGTAVTTGGGGAGLLGPGGNASGSTAGAAGAGGGVGGGIASTQPGAGAGGARSATSTITAGADGLTACFGGCGGASGGAVNSSNATFAGGNGVTGIYGLAGGVAGAPGGGNGGAAPTWFHGYPNGFSGAGGGGAAGTTNGGNGSPGVAGGGGGGGGTCQSGATPGQGGNGGAGLVVFEEW